MKKKNTTNKLIKILTNLKSTVHNKVFKKFKQKNTNTNKSKKMVYDTNIERKKYLTNLKDGVTDTTSNSFYIGLDRSIDWYNITNIINECDFGSLLDKYITSYHLDIHEDFQIRSIIDQRPLTTQLKKDFSSKALNCNYDIDYKTINDRISDQKSGYEFFENLKRHLKQDPILCEIIDYYYLEKKAKQMEIPEENDYYSK